jgi:hypothetical protein
MLSALLVAGTLLVAGCGGEKNLRSGFEGDIIHVGDARYQVQLTRPLNVGQQPDQVLLRGQPPAAATEEYLAVFLTIENKGKQPYTPPRDMKIVDTLGNEYLPLDATLSGFGLDFTQKILPDAGAPVPDSPGAEGPDRGAMVLFRLKLQSATDNLPLELEIPSGPKSTSKIELDV